MQPLRVGLIGAGRVSAAHLPAYRDYPERVVLTGICDRAVPNAQRLAQSLGHERWWTDVDTFLREAEIDAVDVLLPHHLHHPVALAALRAGKHVLVEKPLATSMADARELVGAASQAGCTLMVAHMQRFRPGWRSLQEQLTSGRLGILRHARLDAIQNLHDYAEPPHWLYDGDKAGGGALISILVHRLDLLRYLAGEARRAIAWGRSVDPAFHGAEDYCVGLLELDSGATVDLFTTYSAAALPHGECLWLFTDQTVVHSLPGEGIDERTVPRIAHREATRSGRAFTDLEIEPSADLPSQDPFVNEILHFAACVRDGSEPLTSGRDNLHTMATVFALYESMRRDGAAVDVASILG